MVVRGGSFWSRLAPADLSTEVEKRPFFYQSFTSDTTWRLVIFTGHPVVWAGKSGHINVQGAAELTGQAGKGEEVYSVKA